MTRAKKMENAARDVGLAARLLRKRLLALGKINPDTGMAALTHCVLMLVDLTMLDTRKKK